MLYFDRDLLFSPLFIAFVVILSAYAAHRMRTARLLRHFARRHIDFAPPPSPWSLVANIFRRRPPFTSELCAHYTRFERCSFYGVFDGFGTPLLMVRDPELIGRITVRDFDAFVDRRPYGGGRTEPLLGRSLMASGEQWRLMRATLTRACTGNRLREQFPRLVERSRAYVEAILADVDGSTSHLQRPTIAVRMRDVAQRYACDVNAEHVFGLCDIDSWHNRDNRLYRTVTASMQFNSYGNLAKMALLAAMPGLSRWLGVRLITPQQSEYFRRLVDATMEQSERKLIRQPDMMRLLLEARNVEADRSNTCGSAELGSDDMRRSGGAVPGVRWSVDDVVAQCYLFMFAGTETLSTLLCCAAQELMENPAVQQRLFDELRLAERQLNGAAMTYDVLHGLVYLDMVVLGEI